MTKHHWEGSILSLQNHIDSEKEQELKWVQIGKYSPRAQPDSLHFNWRMLGTTSLKLKQIPFKAPITSKYCYPKCGYMWCAEWQLIRKIKNNSKKILKLAKNINPGNKDGNLKKKAELINLVEDFNHHYDTLYSLYENLRGEVKKHIKGTDDDNPSSSTSESESYYSPEELNVRSCDNSSEVSKASDNEYLELGTCDKEYTIMKDKLTSTSEVKISHDFDSLPDSPEFLENLTIQEEELKKLAQIKELEFQVESLKREAENICMDKKNWEEQFYCKSNEAKELAENISRLEAQVLETESKYKENEMHIASIMKQFEVNGYGYISSISDLVVKTNDLQVELNTLKHQKKKLEVQAPIEDKSLVNGLLEHVYTLENELGGINSQKDELELQLKKKSKENSECLIQIETLRNESMSYIANEKKGQEEKEVLEVRIKNLEMEINSLSSNINDPKERVKKTHQEMLQLKAEKEELNEKIYELQTTFSEKEKKQSKDGAKLKVENKSLIDQVKSLEKKVEMLQNEKKNLEVELETLRTAIKLLQVELEKESSSKSLLEKKNTELSNKIDEQVKTLIELDETMDKLKSENTQAQGKFENIQAQGKFLDSKSNLQIVERKIEDIADEFRKQFEAKYTILSRRIRVAEQLHVETKEWYLKSKDSYVDENKDLKDRLKKFNSRMKSVKEMSLTANDILNSLDTVSLKFEECGANFLNRISKSSCELKFAKDWAMRKNKAVLHMKDELECLVKQLDDKEGEILNYREKVWKSEHKVRDLEKMVKEKDDGMLGLQEEKREAIRQLCVWIDYHKSRSDFYKKTLSEINPGHKRSS